jgi:hypothetical protein
MKQTPFFLRDSSIAFGKGFLNQIVDEIRSLMFAFKRVGEDLCGGNTSNLIRLRKYRLAASLCRKTYSCRNLVDQFPRKFLINRVFSSLIAQLPNPHS